MPRPEYRWDIKDGPNAFSKNYEGKPVVFQVFDQITHETYDLTVRIDTITRQTGRSWDRVFTGEILRNNEWVKVEGLYRPQHPQDKGRIQDK